SCRKRFHPSQAVSHNGTYFCRDCAASSSKSTAQQEAERKKKAIDEEKEERHPKKASEEQPDTQEGKKILYPYAATTYPPPRKPVPLHAIALSGSTLQDSPSPSPPPPPSSSSSSSTQQQRPRRRDIPPDYAHLYTPTFQPLTPSTPKPAREDPSYTTPLPNGTYPRYRPPPPLPLPTTPTLPPVIRPASSIYPSTPGDLGRLSRVPSIPALPDAYGSITNAVSSRNACNGLGNGKDGSGYGNRYSRRRGRSDTLASDTSFRAHVEGEVIDAYADMYAGGRSPVSPISGFEGWERGGEEDEEEERVSVVEEYVGVGWR
ncbi:MAG: hypothetical protein LQ345_007405, partial [Seirophora villosa]